MPKPVADVIDEILDAMRKHEQTTITLSWEGFYALNEIARFKEDRKELLLARGLSKGIILGFGDNAVVACRDRNFAPAEF
ncbi:MAG: hypothetical protein H2049_05235 [Porphyrobacter sp.]|nr:hypothetical protein [Porphyrobacter sp.]